MARKLKQSVRDAEDERAEIESGDIDNPVTWSRHRWGAELMAEASAEKDPEKKAALLERIKKLSFL